MTENNTKSKREYKNKINKHKKARQKKYKRFLSLLIGSKMNKAFHKYKEQIKQN